MELITVIATARVETNLDLSSKMLSDPLAEMKDVSPKFPIVGEEELRSKLGDAALKMLDKSRSLRG
eukprot:CAMPEP_0196185564 /NCGR_PEP_ID=MMETSP0911-20130528/36396_1 /TAXON_ID=49265 /ORGANISM="Thalassiosira rotula, Strain GSO102" /LENGTH=65 /DNA_ID=CAMNT_0041456103 /DNA_START=120 /DNA_END=313 /DNA_ORIENTATION=-